MTASDALQRRLTEAARLGFRRAIVPANSPNGVDGMTLLRVTTFDEARTAVEGIARDDTSGLPTCG